MLILPETANSEITVISLSKVSAVVAGKVTDFMQSNQPVYLSSVLTWLSGLLTYQNVMFSIATLVGMFLSYLAYRSKKKRDLEYIRLRNRDSDAIASYLAKASHMQDVDQAPRVVRRVMDVIDKEAKNLPQERD